MTDTLYITAENYDEARKFATSRNHPCARMVYVDGLDKLMGLHDVTLYVTNLARFRKDYANIMREARIRRLKIEYVGSTR